jgi:hypothetical protein
MLHVPGFVCFDETWNLSQKHNFHLCYPNNQRKLNEQELEQWKEEAKEQWKVFNNLQKAEIPSWHKEKVQLAALKQKAPPKPLEVQMREWMAENYPQLQQNKPFTSPEASRDAGQSVEMDNMCLA